MQEIQDKMKKIIILILVFAMLLLIPTAFATHIVTPVAQYNMNESSGTIMNATFGKTGGVTNSAIWNATGGRVAGALYPNSLYFGSFNLTSALTGNYTIQLWFKQDIINDGVILLDADTTNVLLRTDDSATVRFKSGGVSAVFSVNTLTAGTWYMFTITRNTSSGNVELFINQTSQGSSANDGDLASNLFALSINSGKSSASCGQMK